MNKLRACINLLQYNILRQNDPHILLTITFLFTMQDVGNETYDVCDTSVLKKKIVVTYGQSVHLGCFVKIPEVLKSQQVTWYHHSKEKGR